LPLRPTLAANGFRLVYPRVIVAYDGSPRSLSVRPAATAAAQVFGSPLQFVHVLRTDALPPDDIPDLQVIDAGEPAAGLIEAVRSSTPPGLLCLSTHGRGPVGELVFGSVAALVLQRLHAPALYVGPAIEVDAPRPWRRMLVCLDGSETSAHILPVVRAWAVELGLQLHLLHVAYPLGTPPGGEARIPEEEKEATEQLTAAARLLREDGIEVTWKVEEATRAASGIVLKLQRGAFDLIALATHGRTGLARLLAGSVATDVVRHSPVPVLLLRPEHLR
ncbi:MAG: universal stress protein, partial [Actinobacteria bacterium]|nr:universal stress protein [Actinomycetota bacterium]